MNELICTHCGWHGSYEESNNGLCPICNAQPNDVSKYTCATGFEPIRRGVKRSDVEGAINHRREGQK